MRVAQLVNALRLTPKGLLVLHDDVCGWLMRAQRNGGNVLKLFDMWRGQPLWKSRLDQSPIVDRGFASIAGRIDPAVIHRALNPRIPNDGKLHEYGPGSLLIRLLLAMPPSRSDASTASASASPASESRLAELFNGLWKMDSADDLGCAKAIDLSPSDGARDEFAGFRAHDLGERNWCPRWFAPWSESAHYVLRFALIFHCCRQADRQTAASNLIDADSMRAAVRLVNWFDNEQIRVYRLFSDLPNCDPTTRTIKLIRRKGGRVTVREFQQSDRRFRNDAGGAEAELERMVQLGYGTWEEMPTERNGGRTRVFVLDTASIVYGNTGIDEERRIA
jgi:hypothetical protein